MSSTFKNTTILLLILVFAVTGYYIYNKNKTVEPTNSDNQYVTPDMEKNAQLFMERSNILRQVEVDLAVFDDPLFISYRNFTRPIVRQEQGRTNPFVEFEASQSNNF